MSYRGSLSTKGLSTRRIYAGQAVRACIPTRQWERWREACMTETALREAIATYHDLLTEQMAADSWAQLEDQLRRRGLYFGRAPAGDRAAPPLPHAGAIPLACRRGCGSCWAPLARRTPPRWRDPAVRAQFRADGAGGGTAARRPGLSRVQPDGAPRYLLLDRSGGEDAPQVAEYNAETPAAPAITMC